jgi:hypothetical protein
MTEATFSRDDEYVEAQIIAVTVPPLRIVPESEVQEETFTRGDFEDALDRASRPLKGRLAHVPYSSDDFIKEKKEEVELEDNQS